MHLKDLKKALDMACFSLENSQNLEKEREKFHQELLSLKEKRRQDLINSHRFPKKNLDKDAFLKTSEQMDRLQRKIREIDIQLDEVDEDQEKILHQLKKEIVEMIKEKFPSESKELIRSEEKKIFLKKKQNELSSLKETLSFFYTILKKGTSFPKRRKIFDFLFGRGPAIHLSSAIQQAAIEGEKIKNVIGEGSFREMILEFLEEAEKRWNPSLYKEKIFVFFNKFEKTFHKLEKELTDLDKEIHFLEKDIQNWIDKYCE